MIVWDTCRVDRPWRCAQRRCWGVAQHNQNVCRTESVGQGRHVPSVPKPLFEVWFWGEPVAFDWPVEITCQGQGTARQGRFLRGCDGPTDIHQDRWPCLEIKPGNMPVNRAGLAPRCQHALRGCIGELACQYHRQIPVSDGVRRSGNGHRRIGNPCFYTRKQILFPCKTLNLPEAQPQQNAQAAQSDQNTKPNARHSSLQAKGARSCPGAPSNLI